jgi:hypothetical protein
MPLNKFFSKGNVQELNVDVDLENKMLRNLEDSTNTTTTSATSEDDRNFFDKTSNFRFL